MSYYMRSHSVTCHPAQVTFPPLPQPKLVLDLATRRDARLSWPRHTGCEQFAQDSEQRRDCDSNPCSSEPESGTLTTRPPSHPTTMSPRLDSSCWSLVTRCGSSTDASLSSWWRLCPLTICHTLSLSHQQDAQVVTRLESVLKLCITGTISPQQGLLTASFWHT